MFTNTPTPVVDFDTVYFTDNGARMNPGDVIHFAHPQTGERSVGLYVREWSEHRSICVYVPTRGRNIVVHRANVTETSRRRENSGHPKPHGTP